MEEANSGSCLRRSSQASVKMAFSVLTRSLRGTSCAAPEVLWVVRRTPEARAMKAKRRAIRFGIRNKRIPGKKLVSEVYRQFAQANRAGRGDQGAEARCLVILETVLTSMKPGGSS